MQPISLGKGAEKGKGLRAQNVPAWLAAAKSQSVGVQPSNARVGIIGRLRISTQRAHGKVLEWNGQAGWITPVEAVDHPDAQKFPKGLRLSASDVVPKGHKLSTGANVTFFVFSDGLGLGAESCMEFKGTPPTAGSSTPEDKLASSVGFAKGKGKGKTATLSKGKSLWDPAKGGTWVYTPQFEKSDNRPAKSGGKLNKETGKAAVFSGASRKLPRKRLTLDFPISGTVLEWKGTHGWVSPSEEVDHPKVKSAEGRLYLHKQDLIAATELSVGQEVNFHIFEDKAGLGVEECIGL